MRKPRILALPGTAGKYSISARINLQEFILGKESIKEMFLGILKEAKTKKHFKFGIINFCIMDNHVHLILRIDPGESLSRLMQWVLSVFGRRFNIIFKRKGHVWYDRFKSQLLEAQKNICNAFRYVMNNPVKANIVTKAHNYTYNGITFILKGDFSLIEKPPPYLMELVLAAL